MNHETCRILRPNYGGRAPVRHLVTLNEETELRLVCLSGLIALQTGKNSPEAFHDAAAQIITACINSGALTPDVNHEHTNNLIQVDFKTGEVLSIKTFGTSARSVKSGSHSLSITADFDKDGHFNRLARAYGLTWSQAFSFAASWIIPAHVIQDFKEASK